MRAVVEARLAACANVLGAPVQSIYRWKGKVETAKEVLVLVKSTRKRFSALEREIRRLHSYDTPEIIALPIVDGSKALSAMDRRISGGRVEDAKTSGQSAQEQRRRDLSYKNVSTRKRFSALEREIRRLHSYETPEIIAVHWDGCAIRRAFLRNESRASLLSRGCSPGALGPQKRKPYINGIGSGIPR